MCVQKPELEMVYWFNSVRYYYVSFPKTLPFELRHLRYIASVTTEHVMRRRWSDDCLESSHIPNEVYFGDVPVATEVLFNYYDANAERERLAAQAAQIAAQKAAAAKLAAAKLQARGILTSEVHRLLFQHVFLWYRWCTVA